MALFVSWVLPSLTCVIVGMLLVTGAILVVFRQDSLPLQTTVRYVTLQEIGTSLFVLGWVGHFFEIQTIGLIIKLGLPPFHAWLLECRFGRTTGGLWCLLVTSKLLPLFLILGLTTWTWGVAFVLIGRLAVYVSHTVVNLLVVRSWLTIGWMILIPNSFGVSIVLLTYIVMMGSVIGLISTVNELSPDGMNWVGVLLLVGLPFGRMFLVKFYLLTQVCEFFNGPLIMVLMVLSVLRTVGYYHVYSMRVQMTKLVFSTITTQGGVLGFFAWQVGWILIFMA